jgi:hypothetical protein
MRPYGLDVVNLDTQVRGYWAAVDRFKKAAAGQDAEAAYLSLFEALSWAASIDLRIGDLWVPDGERPRENWPSRAPGAEAVVGLRFARNTVHHDWADALRLDTDGRRYPRRYPLRYFEWVWRDIDDLPAEHRKKGRDVYCALLASQPAEFTLHILGEAFDFVAGLLEPQISAARDDYRHGQERGIGLAPSIQQ